MNCCYKLFFNEFLVSIFYDELIFEDVVLSLFDSKHPVYNQKYFRIVDSLRGISYSIIEFKDVIRRRYG